MATEKCVEKERSQQWLPQADQDQTSFVSRAGGRVSIRETHDGAPIVSEAGGRFVAELLGGTAASPTPAKTSAPAKTSEPTPTSRPTKAPVPTGNPDSAVVPTPVPGARNATFKGPSGTCLTARRSTVRLGPCRAVWQIVPVAGEAVQVRYNGRCLALGAARPGVRTTVLTTCRATAKGQRWLLESQPDSTVTVKSATTRATRLVGRAAGKTSLVCAKAVYMRNALRFVVR